MYSSLSGMYCFKQLFVLGCDLVFLKDTWLCVTIELCGWSMPFGPYGSERRCFQVVLLVLVAMLPGVKGWFWKGDVKVHLMNKWCFGVQVVHGDCWRVVWTCAWAVICSRCFPGVLFVCFLRMQGLGHGAWISLVCDLWSGTVRAFICNFVEQRGYMCWN